MKNSKLDSRVRKIMKSYYMENNHIALLTLGICSIFTKFDECPTLSNLEVHIITQRPGLIIGKGGRDIKNLNKYLTTRINEFTRFNTISIKLHEYDVWS